MKKDFKKTSKTKDMKETYQKPKLLKYKTLIGTAGLSKTSQATL